MKKWLVLFVTVILMFSFTGCLKPPDPSPKDFNPLEIYSENDLSYFSEIFSFFKSCSPESDLNEENQMDSGFITKKLVGQVVQGLLNLKKNQDLKNYEQVVLAELNKMQNDLDSLIVKVNDGFNDLDQALSEISFDSAMYNLNPDLNNITNFWDNNYLNSNENSNVLINYITKHSEAGDLSTSTIQSVTDGFTKRLNDKMSETGNTLENSLNNIHDSIVGDNVFYQESILEDFSDLLVTSYYEYFGDNSSYEVEINGSKYILSFTDAVVAAYLQFYFKLLVTQIQGTVLVAEYYNYTDYDNPAYNDKEIILTDNDYEYVMTDRAIEWVDNLSERLTEQMGVFMNNAEKLISQFNSGDIYREYEGDDDYYVRNSDYYPFIDWLVQLVYGYDNIFVFRLVWSEENATLDIPITVNGETGTFSEVFNKLGNSSYDFDLKLHNESTDEFYLAQIDEDNPENLSCISKFNLYSEDSLNTTFQGGIRRFVFSNIPEDEELRLKYYNCDLPPILQILYTYDGGADYPIFYLMRYKYYFTYSDLLAENNPLSIILDDLPQEETENFDINCVSFTFGAYMNPDEYEKAGILYQDGEEIDIKNSTMRFSLWKEDTYDIQTLSPRHVIFEYMGNVSRFSYIPVDEIGPLYDGDNVYIYGWFNNSYDNRIDTYMHIDKVGKEKSFEMNKDKDKKLTMKVLKKYVTPSGKLFSDKNMRRNNVVCFSFNGGDSFVHGSNDGNGKLKESVGTDELDSRNWFIFW